MNFAHYYNILQQMEKPTFVIDRFDMQITSDYLKDLSKYLAENEEPEGIKRILDNVVMNNFWWLLSSSYIEGNFVKFYDLPNLYIVHSYSLFENSNYKRLINLLISIENADRNMITEMYRLSIKNIPKPDAFWHEIEILSIVKFANNNCYFNINTTEKDYFTLEIIAVIHKIIA